MYAPNRPEALALRYATHLLGAASVDTEFWRHG
jgi:hypothetical protein